MDAKKIQKLVEQDHAHVWHPFTPMKQWRQREPLIIQRAQGDFLYDVRGNRYIDGVSSLWCNVHGHQVDAIDAAVSKQLKKVAHTTMLGLANVPATRLASALCRIAPGDLNKVFYSDAGATATEVAFKMAMGYWYHKGRPDRNLFIGMAGAYHGDTTGAMSIGYSETFHRPFNSMVFKTVFTQAPDVFHSPIWQEKIANDHADQPRLWSQEDVQINQQITRQALADLDRVLTQNAGRVAALVLEPLVQGAAGLVMQPEGYLKQAVALAREHDTLVIADEVAVGLGRTGRMFACEHEQVTPDILCLGKGLSGGYMPLAATLATDRVESAFTGELHEHRTLYHGHTFTGNPLACAAALASLELFQANDLIQQVNDKSLLLAKALDPLRDRSRFPMVADVRRRGLMVGIELSADGQTGTGFDPSRRLGYEVCDAARPKGLIIRPLGNVVVLMPPLGIDPKHLQTMAEIVIQSIEELARQ